MAFYLNLLYAKNKWSGCPKYLLKVNQKCTFYVIALLLNKLGMGMGKGGWVLGVVFIVIYRKIFRLKRID
jgi:hypothetical protein